MSELKVTCKAADTVAIESLVPLQGDLKSLSQKDADKIRASLIQHGVSFPFLAWKFKKITYILDGHQRDSVLKQMAKEGWKIPPLPVVWVEAKDMKEAKQKILLISSRYGRITEDGLRNFAADLDLPNFASMIEIPDFTLDLDKMFPKENIMPDIPESSEPTDRERDVAQEATSVVALVNNDEVILPSSNKWGIPDLRLDMLSDQVPTEVYWRQPEFTPEKTLFLTAWLPPQRQIEIVQGAVLGYYSWDDRFAGVWSDVAGTTQMLLEQGWGSIISPNFSMWLDAPRVLQMYEIYRSRWVARYWQEAGIKIIPDMNWTDDASFEFSFLGIPQHAPVVSMQCQAFSPRHDAGGISTEYFFKGFAQMVRVVKPEVVLMYSGEQHKEEIIAGIPHGPVYQWLPSIISMRKKNAMVKAPKKAKDGIVRKKSKKDAQQ